MKVGSLFSGIGGIDLGLERAGMSVVWQCESDPYCRAVLRRHWPDVPCYEDVRDITADTPAVDLLCGGFPCQPVSLAGYGRAQEDERWLWPEFARVVRDLRPPYVLVENVPGLLARGMGDVLGDLASLGFDAEWDCIPAVAVGAPHLRYRVLVVAYPTRDGGLGGESVRRPRVRTLDGSAGERGSIELGAVTSDVADPEGITSTRGVEAGIIFSEPVAFDGGWWAAEPDVGRVAHGVPARVDRLRALGNAVVPQVAEWIGHRIMTATHHPGDGA